MKSQLLVVVALFALVFMSHSVSQSSALGGWNKISTSDEGVLQAAEYALESLNARSNSIYPFHLVKVTEAYVQVVAGLNYRIKFESARENSNEITTATAQVYVKPLTSGANEPEYEVTNLEVLSSN